MSSCIKAIINDDQNIYTAVIYVSAEQSRVYTKILSRPYNTIHERLTFTGRDGEQKPPFDDLHTQPTQPEPSQASQAGMAPSYRAIQKRVCTSGVYLLAHNTLSFVMSIVRSDRKTGFIRHDDTVNIGDSASNSLAGHTHVESCRKNKGVQ